MGKQSLREEDEQREEEEVVIPVDPGHPAEEYARALMGEGVLEKEQIETLASMLPLTTKAPRRFGEQGDDGGCWGAGTYVHGGVIGVSNTTKAFPCTTAVLAKYMRQLFPEVSFSALFISQNIKAQAHKDVHNVGMNLIAPLSVFDGGGLLMEPKEGESYVLDVASGPVQFDPRVKHTTMPWTGSTRMVLVGYNTRGASKLEQKDKDYLLKLGFVIDHRPLPDPISGPPVGRPRIAKARPFTSPKEDRPGCPIELRPLHGTNEDLDLVLKDLDERALRLRDLLEEEEVLAEEYQRMGQISRDALNDAREEVVKFLEETREQMVEIDRAKMLGCLRVASMATAGTESDDVDYENLLQELEGDLDVVHTVPLVQVKAVLQKWVGAIKEEVTALFSSGTVFGISLDEARTMEASGDLKVAPAKCVFSLKPPKSRGGKFRRKCRVVICGNHIDPSDMSLYAGGTSTEGLRVALVFSARNHWLGAISDITTAFLLATWPGDMPKYAMRPPKVVRDTGIGASEMWVISRPLYGLRESPATWSNYRNARLKGARIKFGDRILYLNPALGESELWLVRDQQTGRLEGLVVTYVDDLFYFGPTLLIRALHDFIREEWPTSELEWVNDKVAVRYLGVEVLMHGSSYSISQHAYITELLRAHDMHDALHAELPIPREWLEKVELDEDGTEEFSEEELRLAQRYVGEASWVATKTRPDILFVVNQMATNVCRRPLHVARLGRRLLSYLAGTAELRLKLTPQDDKLGELVCFKDASYAPYGARSFGAAVITQDGAPIAWKAGRQSFITLSVMEAELYAAVHGCNLLESVASIVEELAPGEYERILAVDNTSAVAMCNGGQGSQRTRHLKIRANYIRESVARGTLTVRHVAGAQQLADLATKIMTRLRLRQLLELWGFIGVKIAEGLATMQLRVLSIILVITPTTGAKDVDFEKDDIPRVQSFELIVITLLACISAIAIWEAAKGVLRWCKNYNKKLKKEERLERIRDVASRAASREVAEAAQFSGLTQETPAAPEPLTTPRSSMRRRRPSPQPSPEVASVTSDAPTEVRDFAGDRQQAGTC